MRKKTVNRFFDTAFWYILYFLPVIAFILVAFRTGELVTLSTAMSTCGLDILLTNPVMTSLNQIFGADGILPFFQNADLINFFTYFISVFICHIFVDFLLFIPRLAHKWMNKFCQGDE